MGPGWLSLLILNALTLKTERPNQVKVPIWQVLCSFQIWFPKPKEALSSHRAVAQSRYRLEPIPIALSYLLLYLTVRASAECLRRTCRDVVIMPRRCARWSFVDASRPRVSRLQPRRRGSPSCVCSLFPRRFTPAGRNPGRSPPDRATPPSASVATPPVMRASSDAHRWPLYRTPSALWRAATLP